MSTPIMILMTVAICISQLAALAKGLSAPNILEHPPSEQSYRLGDDITLPCKAVNPDGVVYSWRKDGQPLDLTGGRVFLKQSHKSGELTIKSPNEGDEGVYQCFVTNEMGTAVTVKSLIRRAFFNSFPSVTEAVVLYLDIGKSLSIGCTPPNSFPKDIPYWGISLPGSKTIQALSTDDRVLVDYEGKLHFAHIQAKDELSDGKIYVCILHNEAMRSSATGGDTRIVLANSLGRIYFANVNASDGHEDRDYICILKNEKLGAIVHGNNHKIRPNTDSGRASPSSPALLWSSPTRDVAVKGQNKKLKCIFGGFPTPKVTWKLTGRTWTSRTSYTKEGQGTEIEILNVDETDGGEYECSATNAEGTTTHKVQLVVESRPYWNPPLDVSVEEEGEAEFKCQAHGAPKPEISWSLNGEPLESLGSDPRRVLRGNILRFTNVNKTDTQVIQCTASNSHGSILANAHLTVISLPPSFMKTPQDTKVVKGSTVTLECHSYGAPRPVITWHKGRSDSAPLTGPGYRMDGGNLIMEDIDLDNEGEYICKAENKHDVMEVSAKVSVREPTVISPSPAEILANRTDDVTLECDVITDQREYSNLKVEWKKNGKTIDYNVDNHLAYDSRTYSLTVRRSRVKDTAQYTCHADNGLDTANSDPTQLLIRDRPEPPVDLEVDTCTSYSAEISFTPGEDNNDPITSFTVYYSIQADNEQDQLVKGPVIQASQFNDDRIKAHLDVQPWRTYTFYVAATNNMGTSELSVASSEKCTTPETAPNSNPKNVCTRFKGPRQMVITWEAMPKEKHYGSGFQYVVEYKEKDSREPVKSVDILNPSTTELVVNDLPVFTKYEISVWAKNNQGDSPRATRERKIGYSSEGRPKIRPTNFRINGDKFNGTYAEFVWDRMETTTENVQGFFRGYRIKFWKTNDPNNIRTEDVILDDSIINLCPDNNDLLPSRRRRQADNRGPIVFGATHKLWPFSKITAGVSVINSAYDGNISDTVEFETPEGPPEAVKDLLVTETGSSHLVVTWSLPSSANGAITSFILEYQVAPPEVGALRKEILKDPSTLSRKIWGLQSQTIYRITLYAVTVAGPGQAIYVDGTTLSDSNPDEPKIYRVEAGVDSANISFVATANPPKKNPGSKFYVEYTKEGSDNGRTRKDVDPHNPENWVQVDGLDQGAYVFRVVAVNGRDGHEQETKSEAMIINIGQTRDYVVDRPVEEGLVQHAGASASWFIVLMCLIILLLIVLFIICYMKHGQGDVYPVYEKEKALGRDPFAPEDAPFGEYTNPGVIPDHHRSQVSIESEDKPVDSDSDSLGEYEDQDTSKFNEDGSFIGLYGGRGQPKSKPASNSMNTFV